MRFLFIFPPGQRFIIADKKVLPPGPYSPPLGLLYLSKMLEKKGHIVEVLDYNAENVNVSEFKKKIESADAIGMTVYTNSLDESIDLAHLIKNYNPNIPLLIGGPHCNIAPEKAIIDLNADICATGDVESIICAIADVLQGKGNLSSIPGIYYKYKGKIKKTKRMQLIKELDLLPFPARHLVAKYDYGYFIGEKLINGRTTSIITTRGCPYHCGFCGYNSVRSRYDERSVENVIKEIEGIISQGYHSIIIVDNNFLANKKRAEEIMDRIIENRLKINMWIMGARVDSAERRLFEKMRDAGVRFICFGIESGNQDVLNLYNKKTTLKQITKAIRLSKEMGFFTSGNFIIGATIETKEHIENTIKFAKSLPLDVAHFLILRYVYGSPLWSKAVDDGIIKQDEYSVTANSQRNLGLFTEEELKNYCIKAYRNFYFNPRYILRQLLYALKNKNFRFIKAGLNMFTTHEV
jgi:anaerobic magnesium-protoporphyrin IX monomethyl ester cyclase